MHTSQLVCRKKFLCSLYVFPLERKTLYESKLCSREAKNTSAICRSSLLPKGMFPCFQAKGTTLENNVSTRCPKINYRSWIANSNLPRMWVNQVSWSLLPVIFVVFKTNQNLSWRNAITNEDKRNGLDHSIHGSQ